MKGTRGSRVLNEYESDEADPEAKLSSVTIVKQDDLIINKECKQIMRNLCNFQAGWTNFQAKSTNTEVTQPSLLSKEERLIFFRTKIFYLLQERYCLLQKCEEKLQQQQQQPSAEGRPVSKTVADAYPPIMSPFYDPSELTKDSFESLDRDNGKRRRRKPGQEMTALDGTRSGAGRHKGLPDRTQVAIGPQRTSSAKFLEQLRKADILTLHMLDEKILKTLEGAGHASLLTVAGNELKKIDVLQNLFPDYKLLLSDGKDEESRLDNLVNHVRTRMKIFDKMQSFYENLCLEDHMALVFTMPNLVEISEVREEVSNLKTKRLHMLDEMKLTKLYDIFKDDYGCAKTTLIADGTQPVVLSRKRLDRVKKYVDECVDFKGSMLVPYNQETNFFFLSFPWTAKSSGESTQRWASGGTSDIFQ